MEPREFVKRIDDLVADFLRTPGSASSFDHQMPIKEPPESLLDDPELAAAAREGFESNPVAKAYALGYSAGEAMAGTGEAALQGLKGWIEARSVGFATGALGSGDILAEIEARLIGGK